MYQLTGGEGKKSRSKRERMDTPINSQDNRQQPTNTNVWEGIECNQPIQIGERMESRRMNRRISRQNNRQKQQQTNRNMGLDGNP
jgi:hypothetical protein